MLLQAFGFALPLFTPLRTLVVLNVLGSGALVIALINAAMGYFRADLLMRLGSNAAIREALTGYTTSAALNGTLVLFFLAVLAHISPVVAVTVVVIALMEVIILAATNQRLHSLVERDLAWQSGSQTCVIESLMGITTLKVSGTEGPTLARWLLLWREARRWCTDPLAWARCSP